MPPVLVDTNVLIYAHDSSEPDKHSAAVGVLERLYVHGSGRLSAQCLSEFFAATTRGAEPLLTRDEAAAQVERFGRSWTVYPVTSMIVLEAIRGLQQHSMSFWDAQIWAAARLNQVGIIFSEDFQDGQVVEGVRYVNPFSSRFEFDTWT